MHTRTRSRLLFALAGALALNVQAVHEAEAITCDVPMIAQQVSVPPNVMIVYDNSGSMNEAEWHEDFDASIEWTGPGGTTSNSNRFTPDRMYYVGSDGWRSPRNFNSNWPSSPSVYLIEGLHDQNGRYVGNYLNWLFYHATDEQRDHAPRVTRQMIANTAIKQVINSASGLRYGMIVFDYDNGGRVVAECGTPLSNLNDEIDNTVANDWTPTGETLVDVIEYFKDDDGPIEYACQKNFVIVVTDGVPTKDRNFPSWIGDADGDGLDPGDCESIGAPPSAFGQDCSHWMDDAAYYMANRDLSDLSGDQNAYTYTVGFGIDAELLRLTAEKGQGLYRVAWDLDTLVQELGTVVGDIVNRISSGAAVAVVSTETGTDDRLYRGKFLPGEWKGYLEAFDLPYHNGDSPVWEAGRILRDQAPFDRTLFTSLNNQRVEFKTTNADVLGLYIAPDGPGSGTILNDGFGADADGDFDLLDQVYGPNYDEDYVNDLIEYVRGEEIEGFRDRGGWKLGDLVYSTPVVVGAPVNFYSDPDYHDFAADHENRTPVVYVGANDGMIHAFKASSGHELWSYLPNVTMGKLEALADPNYCHTSFVDLSPRAYDVKVNGAWRTVLFGGQRTGGDSYFALDVTNPYAPEMMWETRVPTMTSSYTDPVLIQTNRGPMLWVGSGPNASGQAWSSAILLESGYVYWNLPLSTISGVNGATAPTAYDADFDGIADYVYQADMAGNVYRYDITSETGWFIHTMYSGSEPITARPSVLVGDDLKPNIIFGTGRFVESSDFTTATSNRFLFLEDDGTVRTLTSSDLEDRSSDTSEMEVDDGWYIWLENGAGERVTEPAVAIEGVIYFSAFAPSTAPCDAGGRSWLYAIDMDGGMPIDSDEDGDIDDESRSESLGEGVASRPVTNLAGEELILQTSDAEVHTEDMLRAPQKVLIRAWRERFDAAANEIQIDTEEGTQ